MSTVLPQILRFDLWSQCPGDTLPERLVESLLVDVLVCLQPSSNPMELPIRCSELANGFESLVPSLAQENSEVLRFVPLLILVCIIKSLELC